MTRTGRPTPGTPPPHRPSSLAVVLLVTLAAIGLLAATFVVGTRIGQQSPDTAAPGATTPTTSGSTDPKRGGSGPTTTDEPKANGPTTTDPTIGDTVTTIQRFVERERGLRFKEPVRVEALAPEAFKQRVLAVSEVDRPAQQKQGELLKAAGLVPADLDVVEAQRSMLGDGVLGFYDPKTKELVVRGNKVTPFPRQIIAHELTHALDDQHFGLDRPDLTERHDGSDWAFLALVEGSAKRVENEYVAEMTAQERQQLDREQLELSLGQMDSISSLPLVLPQLLMSPYDYGEPFVRRVVDQHGIGALDRAMTDPPTTSEQILDNTKFDVREGARRLDAPPVDGTLVEEGTLGELMTGFVLHGKNGLGGPGGLGLDGSGLDGSGLEGIDPNQLSELLDQLLDGSIDPEQLEDLLGGGSSGSGLGGLLKVKTVKGWAGDHYVTYHPPAGGVCMRVDWAMDSPAALQSMTAALDTWAASDVDKAATIEHPTGETVRATRCTKP